MAAQATSTKATLLFAIGLGLPALGCDGSALEDGRASTDRRAVPESSRAALRLAELAKTFPVLSDASLARFREFETGRVRAELGGDAAARVTLPAAIDGWVELEHVPSRLGIRFARIGAGTAPLGVSGGLALYSNANAPVDDIHRALPEGVEDFVAFAERPPVETLSYRVEVTRVAGLRLVGATLEFLDASGTPRLRVAPPYFLDRGGKRHPAALGVDGCRVDTDPRGPWGRPTVAPGAATCVVSVRWKADDYPILVDPRWTTTDNMAVGRTQFREAPLLPSGRVLVAGGIAAGEPIRLAEIYDPMSGTFSDTGALSVPRGSPGISALPSGKILITGGWGGGSSWHASAEIYDETSGEWTTTTESMSSPRQSHSQNLLLSGMVLIAGGSSAGSFLFSAELFDPADESFTDTDALKGIRSLHTGTLLSNGDVLIAGGENTETAELYDHTSETFSITGPMSEDRGNHAAVSLGDRKALVVGGWANSSGSETALQTAEIYDGVTGMFTTTTGTMAEARRWPTATVLDSGLVLVVGGSANNTVGLASAELFDPMEGTFSSAMQMTVARLEHAATRLMNGSVVVIGGMPNTTASAAHRSASLYLDKSNGSSCEVGDDCRSTFCVDGICCESACTGERTCATGACVDGGSGAGGEASGGSSGSSSGSGTGGSSGSNPGGSATGGSSGTGATSGASSGTGGDAPGSGGDTGAGGDGSGTVCSTDSDCAEDHYCGHDVCVPRTPLESACGCNIPGRRVPNGMLLACALLGGGIALRRRSRRSASSSRPI